MRRLFVLLTLALALTVVGFVAVASAQTTTTMGGTSTTRAGGATSTTARAGGSTSTTAATRTTTGAAASALGASPLTTVRSASRFGWPEAAARPA